jgi:hypothetical protein
MSEARHAMYIANCTAQVQDFQYTLPGAKKARKQTIEVGRQIRISGDLTLAQIESIVKQHAKYGMLACSEVPRAKTFAPYVFNTERPVPRTVTMAAVLKNRELKDKEGREIRDRAAVSVHNAIEQELEAFKPLALRELETHIEEVNPKDTKKADGEHEQINEITRITRTEAPQPPTRGASRASGTRRRRAA